MHGSIGPYLITGELARGGMGVIYRATDQRVGREVAVKLLQANGVNQRLRFQREIHSLTQLRHRYVVAAHDAGVHRGYPFLVLDLVEGESLQHRLDRFGPLEPAEAVDLVRKLAQAVGYANRHGILHRDIKPANVLIDEQGEPRLTDFGLAKLTDGDTHALSQTGMSHGTPGFWAPEQATGDLSRIGAPTDVYGLGATLYAALTGRAPLDGPTFMELLIATRELRPDTPAVDPVLDRICLRCLEKDPGARFGSAEALEAALDEWEPSEPGPGLAHWLALGGGAVVSTLVLVLVFLFGRPEQAAQTAPDAVAAVASAEEAEPAESKRLLRVVVAKPKKQTPQAEPEVEPETAKEWSTRAHALADAGDYDRAVQAYDRALAVRPGHAGDLNARGWSRWKQGDLEGAEKDYTAALLANPMFHQAYVNRGLVYHSQDRNELALADISIALERGYTKENTKRASILADRASIYLALGRHDEAEADCAEALRIAPKHRRAQGVRAIVRQGRGDIQGSMEDLASALNVKEDIQNDRAVGLERLSQQCAEFFDPVRYARSVRPVPTVNLKGMLGLLGKQRSEEIAAAAREVCGVLATPKGQQELNAVIFMRFGDEAGAGKMLQAERDVLEMKTKQLKAAGVLKAMEWIDLELPYEGMRYVMTVVAEKEVATSYGLVFRVGPIVLEVTLSQTFTRASSLELAKKIAERIETALRKGE